MCRVFGNLNEIEEVLGSVEEVEDLREVRDGRGI